MHYFIALFLSLFLTACASKTTFEVAPEDWTYQERAIHIHASAPADLNVISGRPHSLAIGIFQGLLISYLLIAHTHTSIATESLGFGVYYLL